MKFWSSLAAAFSTVPAATYPAVLQPSRTFGVTVDSGTLYGVQSLDDMIAMAMTTRRVSRREAMSVPAVKRAHDLVCGGLGQLPLRMHDPANKVIPWELFDAPEAGKASVITWTEVVADLMFDGVAHLRITHTGWHGLPAQCVRLDPESVSYRPELRMHYSPTGSGTSQSWPHDPQVIRIDSPFPPLLTAGARAIRALFLLESAALESATGVPPQDYFTPAEGADPATDAEIIKILDMWREARQTRTTGYVPAALKYNSNGFSPEQLQLVEAREMAITEVARLTGVDTEDLGVSTTSRTYFNAVDRRRERLDFVLGPYRRAIEGALTRPEVTPLGHVARFDAAEFAKADDYTTAQTDEIDIRSGVLTRDEARVRRGLEPLGDNAPRAIPAPADAPKEIAR